MNKKINKKIFCVLLLVILLPILVSNRVFAAEELILNTSESNIESLEFSNRALPNRKLVYFSVRFPKYSLPSSSRYYDDGVYRGWIPLEEWEDLSSKKDGYVIGYYRGYANRINIPLR